jgi:hypothetical protein
VRGVFAHQTAAFLERGRQIVDLTLDPRRGRVARRVIQSQPFSEIEGRLPKPLRQRLGMAFEPIDNRQTFSERPRGDRFVRFTGRRDCDCGVAPGCRMPPHDRSWWWYSGKTKGEYSLSQEADRKWRHSLKEARRWLSLFRYLADELLRLLPLLRLFPFR